jgi:tRNA (cmo5U34)-methyltransferase
MSDDSVVKAEKVRDNFSELSKTYSDENRRRMIPCFDDFYRCGVSVLRCQKDSPRVLDLGAGTGLFANAVIKRYPSARLTLVDFSEEMIAFAKARFGTKADTEYIIGDYTNAQFEGKFDIIVSALSIHHLDAVDKEKLYKKVFGLLADGGEFLNADQMKKCGYPSSNRAG